MANNVKEMMKKIMSNENNNNVNNERSNIEMK